MIQPLGIARSLATAANDFIVASGAGVFVKKTLAEVKAILGLERSVMSVPPGIIFDAPFDNPANPLVLKKGTGSLSNTRATTATYVSPVTGLITQAAVNQLRIEENGALIEGQRTNHFLQSDAPATQTTPSLGVGTYTLKITGTGSIAVTAGSATITGGGSAVAGTPLVFVVTVAGTVVYTVTGTPTTAQSEEGSFPSSYIPTISAAVTRDADELYFPSSGNAFATEGTIAVYASTKIPVTFDNPNDGNIVSARNGGDELLFIARRTTGSFAAYDGTGYIDSSVGITENVVHGMASRWGGSKWKLALDGSVVYDGTANSGTLDASFTIGGALTSPMFGHIKNLRIFNRALTDSEMQDMTNPNIDVLACYSIDQPIRTDLGTGFSLTSGTVPKTLTVDETVAMSSKLTIPGAWVTPTFNAANFTAVEGVTWTVAEADCVSYSYTIMGKVMILNFFIDDSSVSADSSILYIAIPLSKVCTKTVFSPNIIKNNGTVEAGYCIIAAGQSVIQCYRPGAAVWTASTNNTRVTGQIIFEID